MAEFQKYPKTPRFNREWIITEKIDGTNAAVVIEKIERTSDHPDPVAFVIGADADELPDHAGHLYAVYAQSRNRFITPAADNFGFAKWVFNNAEQLVDTLGEGVHFGEWAGPGIQGNPHELEQRHLFLFNVKRWGEIPKEVSDIGLTTVPLLHDGESGLTNVDKLYALIGATLADLEALGSLAAFTAEGRLDDTGRAEGIIVYSTAANQAFKITLENDDKPKDLK